jgi:hypothetical protein
MNYFSNETSIPLFDSLINDKSRREYERDEKNREIFKIKMSPYKYLELCEKGFKNSSPDTSFIPEQRKLNSLRKAFSDIKYKLSDKLIPLPNLEETYIRSFDGDSQEYNFSQEGRHRALVAIENGIEEIDVIYFRSCDMKSKIGMDEFVKEKFYEFNLDSIKTVVIELLKNNNIDFINFNIDIKRYLDNRLGGFSKYEFEENFIPTFYLNYFIDDIIENFDNLIVSNDFIYHDTILHEYGHFIYSVLEMSETDLIKDYYSDFNTIEFKEFVYSYEGIVIDDDEIDYYIDEYLDLFIEEHFAEDFVKFIRNDLNNIDFKNIISLFNNEIKEFDLTTSIKNNCETLSI